MTTCLLAYLQSVQFLKLLDSLNAGCLGSNHAQAGRISIVGVYAGFTNNFNIGAARLPLGACMRHDEQHGCQIISKLVCQRAAYAAIHALAWMAAIALTPCT